MIVKTMPHPDQIRWYAESALNGFETLDEATAIENAKSDLQALLRYLDLANEATSVLGVAGVETRVGNETAVQQTEVGDQSNLKVVRFPFVSRLGRVVDLGSGDTDAAG